MQPYTIIGPGAVGIYLACLLSDAGFPVRLVHHDPEPARNLDRQGITLERGERRTVCRVPVTAWDTAVPDGIGLICVKAYTFKHLPLDRLQGCDAICVIQNGIRWIDGLSAVRAGAAVGAAVAYCGVTRLASGTARLQGEGPVHVGALSTSAGPLFNRIAADFRQAGLDARPTGRIVFEAWKKLAVNAGINPLTVLYDSANGALLDGGERETRLSRIVRECVAVARAEGMDLDPDERVAAAQATCRATASNISSMLQDIRAGRPTEIEAITGAVIAAADRHGIDVPACRDVYRCVNSRTS